MKDHRFRLYKVLALAVILVISIFMTAASELFDSVFIHWGQSASKGAYVGADTVFEQDEVDHINQTEIADKTGLFDRDSTRNVSMEHTGIAYGAKVPAALEEAAVRMQPKDYTHLDFSKLAWLVSVKPAQYVRVTYSDRAAWERTAFTYDPEDQKYHTANFQNDFSRDNLLILFDDTEYIDKANYKGEVGNTVTYCDYALGGGEGKLFSKGMEKDIKWQIVDGKLELIDTATDAETAQTANDEAKAAAIEEVKKSEDGTWPVYNKYTIVTPETEEEQTEEEALANSYVLQNLNKGKTWIGWISKNNGGSVTFK